MNWNDEFILGINKLSHINYIIIDGPVETAGGLSPSDAAETGFGGRC